jgi:hypothetical protein
MADAQTYKVGATLAPLSFVLKSIFSFCFDGETFEIWFGDVSP